mmetsp:Transcript_44183/g.32156  ORF Transcript_44183/g.32156 Transcript_44183/m.32156 type:complete len:125 (+) Transcript_44183:55-429(+)|eukprot:CAMPEP_0202972472 /NCGR_PEP_ID=MMETSP1396-20130829/36882_1 /ASSEMBLY_ACC=CAM_ASM_000872 /TAXON_ID= /ORGANISM="Pseudokeronopsis sp., Strain Brazil" /LENGTH=124 /DNA_ID=CAMNT_0049702931 /DNA_START=60 /DNA_END=434 /DNA_ORIENTATION=+
MPNLYMSDVSGAGSLEELQKRNITHIVTVSANLTPKFPDFFEYLVVPIDDRDSEDAKVHFKKAIDFIDKALADEGAVLIHCAAGISRSGCITCAYLMWKNKWTFSTAWEYGKSKRKGMYPNRGF